VAGFFYFNNLKLDIARRPIPMIPITALVDDGRIPKNNKVADVNAVISPAINKMMLIVLLFIVLPSFQIKLIQINYALKKA